MRSAGAPRVTDHDRVQSTSRTSAIWERAHDSLRPKADSRQAEPRYAAYCRSVRRSSMRRTTFTITIATALLACAPSSGAPLGPPKFSEETLPFSHPVSIPPSALAIVLRTNAARSVLRDLTVAERQNISQYFEAQPINLAKVGDKELLIRGQGKISGADNDWYWIIASYKHHPRLILFTGCLSLEIQSTKTHGYDDILSLWNSASVMDSKLFRFNGTVYRLSRYKSRRILPTATSG